MTAGWWRTRSEHGRPPGRRTGRPEPLLNSAARSSAAPPADAGNASEPALYLAELLADACQDVQRVIDGVDTTLREVLAVREDGPMQFTLSWVQKCLDDPHTDNIGFKFAGALKDFGENDRAAQMYEQLK